MISRSRMRTVASLSSWLALSVFLGAALAGESQPMVMLGPMPDPDRPRVVDSTADHSRFEELKEKKFRKARDVTRACLGCHNEGAKQLHQTKHWTWEYSNSDTGQELGARNIINNFFMSTASNEASCSHCHIGSGWKGNRIDLDREDNVDCLTCHDTTGEYAFKKFHTARGNCVVCHEEVPETPGDNKRKVDLNRLAQQVGPTSRRTCGSCHFLGGGGINVKHGDLDSSLTRPGRDLDVHMDAEGLDFTCTVCHSTDQHAVRGSRYYQQENDVVGETVPGRLPTRRSSCRSCHGDRPMHDEKLNDHTDKLACQTCHIPRIARGGYSTKVMWDWSAAGKLDANGEPYLEKDDHGREVYSTQRGTSRWAEDLVPEYVWRNGAVTYTLLSDTIDPRSTVPINTFDGHANDPDSRIWPVKVMRGRQPYDKARDSLLAVNLFAVHRSAKDDDPFWRSLDWARAARVGMEQRGLEFSGEVGFVETSMLWPVNHMVAPAAQALSCADCHQEPGRLDAVQGVYIPGRSRVPWIDWIGWLMVVGTGAGVAGHGFLRTIMHTRRKRNNV
jgi:octaheme c-type cytochrome (tetrathionate reductase family)